MSLVAPCITNDHAHGVPCNTCICSINEMGKKGCLQNECAFGCVKEPVPTVTVNVKQVSNEVSFKF